ERSLRVREREYLQSLATVRSELQRLAAAYVDPVVDLDFKLSPGDADAPAATDHEKDKLTIPHRQHRRSAALHLEKHLTLIAGAPLRSDQLAVPQVLARDLRTQRRRNDVAAAVQPASRPFPLGDHGHGPICGTLRIVERRPARQIRMCT